MKYPLFLLLFCLACGTAKKAIPEQTITIYHAGMHTTILKRVADDLGLTDGCTIYTEMLFKAAVKADEKAKQQ